MHRNTKCKKQNIKEYASISVLFEVINSWKRVRQSQLIITTGQGGGDCMFDFKEGKEYLVYDYESTILFLKRAYVDTVDESESPFFE